MALQLTLYSFTKRKNSTAIPSSGGLVVDVVLKKETSFNNPIFVLHGGKPTATYALFENAYYFIDDLISVRDDIWELVCSIDPLGTLRAGIMAASAFVEYAEQGNTQIVDQRLGVEYGVAGVNTQIGGGAIPYMDVDINDSGKFITVVGQSSTETFFISDAALLALFDQISQWVTTTIDDTDILTALVSGFRQLIGSGSAADCIRDAYCLPIVAPLSVLAPAQTLYLGMFNTQLAANRVVGAGNVTRTESIAIPHQYSDWRKQAPYEVCHLFLPLYGTIEIPSDIAADSTSLSVTSILNVRSGDFTYYVSGNGRGEKEIVVGGNCAASLAVGASNITMSQAVSSGLALGTNIAFGNAAGAAASLMGISPTPTSVGQAGGISNRSPRLECYVYYRNTSDAPGAAAAVQGVPLEATRVMNTLSGYVKTRGFSVGGSYRGILKQMVNDMMDSGVFLE